MKKRSVPAPQAPASARERIVQTALKLFYQEGIRATGIDRIIAESAVAKMSFYRHFPSKNDLIAECLNRHHLRWMERFVTAVERQPLRVGTGLEALADVLQEWFAEPGFRGCPFINALAESPLRKSAPNKKVREHKAALERYIAGQAAKLGWDAPETAAAAVMVAVEGAIVRAQTTGGTAAAGLCRELIRKIGVDARKPPRPLREGEEEPVTQLQLFLPGLL